MYSTIKWQISTVQKSQLLSQQPSSFMKMKVLVSQLCPALSMDCSPPGSSVCRIFQARILEWVATEVLSIYTPKSNAVLMPGFSQPCTHGVFTNTRIFANLIKWKVPSFNFHLSYHELKTVFILLSAHFSIRLLVFFCISSQSYSFILVNRILTWLMVFWA